MTEPLNIVTIIAKNYLAQARTLVDSFRKYNSAGEAFVLLADHIDGYFDPSKENFNLIEIGELRNEIPDLESFCYQYTILELSTALKPYLLNYIFTKFKTQKLAYFDPDILITNDLSPLSKLLDNYDIVLTPHITTPFSDNYKPSEIEILRSGAYNLGFIALTNSKVTLSMLDWWKKRLYKQCLVDLSKGLFVDQKWIDLVPGFFPETYILRDPGYNVAYWNLHERRITIENDKFYCNSVPLYFFHFSGYSPNQPKEVSKHQNRHSFSRIGKASKIFSLYYKLLVKNGYHEVNKWSYAFSYFDNGVEIPDLARRIFLNLDKRFADSFGNPFKTSLENSFFKWLTSIDKSGLSPLLREIYSTRPDLQKAFPDVEGKNRYRFLFWAINDGKVQHGISDCLLENVKFILKDYQNLKGIDIQINGLVGSSYKSIMWNKMRSLYYYLRKISILRPLLEKSKIMVINKLKRGKQYYPLASMENRKSESFLMGNSGNRNVLERDLTFGVNVAGYIESEKGMGEAVRSDIRCLQTASVPFVINNFVDSRSKNQEIKINNFSRNNPYSINLIHINADQVSFFIQQNGLAYLNDHYNIGYWTWELSHFPEEWYPSFCFFNEIWVPTNFVQNAVSKVSPVPVIVIPHSIEKVSINSLFNRIYFGLPDNAFIFLFIFDFDSFMARKNLLGLIRAFKNAFAARSDVILIIKSSHSEHYPNDFQILKEESKGANIKFIDTVLTREEINSLLYLSDCYVSLHRSEGFGLTMAEAMYMGKPVIATGYSGNMDFMTPWNSYLINYSLVEIDRDYGPYKKGWLWAEPDIEETSKVMYYVFKNRKEAEARGQLAKRHIQQYFNPNYVGQIYKERLYFINELIKQNNNLKINVERTKEIEQNKMEKLSMELETIKHKVELIDMNKIPISSKKPVVRTFLILFKRMVRKSTYWLFDPLFYQIRDLNNSILDFQSRFVRELIVFQKQIESKNLEQTHNLIKEKLNNLNAELLPIINQNAERVENSELAFSNIQTQVSDLYHRLNNLNADIFPIVYRNPEVIQSNKGNSFDYYTFEKVFRGTEELLKERQSYYLKFFKDCKKVLDVGCGRGEFITILQEAGINTIGVDINHDMVEICKKKGLNVIQNDFLEYISKLPDESLDGVFSAQFIEHLHPYVIDKFFKYAYKKIKTGGIIVMETVNPYNLAQFRFFCLDPTHEKPIYPEFAEFLCRTAGFVDIEIEYLPCFGETRSLLRKPWDFGDYAIIAFKG